MKLRLPWFIFFVAGMLVFAFGLSHAEDEAYFKAGPLGLHIPFKSARVTYLYDFHANQNLVGGETPIADMWNRVEGTVGVITSLEGQGTPFIGGNILIGNLLEKWLTLPPDLLVGGYGGYNFNSEAPIYGLKASIRLW
jgi:hypothetical protein